MNGLNGRPIIGIKETVISKEDLRALPEYSCSLPTGVVLGKRWRRDTTFRRRAGPGDPALVSEWLIGEFHKDEPLPEGVVAIRWSWAVSEPGVPHRGDLR